MDALKVLASLRAAGSMMVAAYNEVRAANPQLPEPDIAQAESDVRAGTATAGAPPAPAEVIMKTLSVVADRKPAPYTGQKTQDFQSGGKFTKDFWVVGYMGAAAGARADEYSVASQIQSMMGPPWEKHFMVLVPHEGEFNWTHNLFFAKDLGWTTEGPSNGGFPIMHAPLPQGWQSYTIKTPTTTPPTTTGGGEEIPL